MAYNGMMPLQEAAVVWGVHDSTIRKAIAVGRFSLGVDARKFGKQWFVTKEAMDREFGTLHVARQRLAAIRVERKLMAWIESMKRAD